MYKDYTGNLLAEEVRSVLRFLCAKYVFSTEINGQLIEVYIDKVMRESSILENGVEFQNGRKNIHNDNCTGRPDTSKRAETSAQVEI